jgi:hypothetical protein
VREQESASKRPWSLARLPIAAFVAAGVLVATAGMGSAAPSKPTWTQQREFTSTGAYYNFGSPAAVSGDGSTALVGANGAAANTFVYTRSGTVWKLQAKLSLGAGSSALSSDGGTALLGGYVFQRSGTTWTEQQELIPSSDAGAVALSGDGNTALIAVPGGVYPFHRSGTTWTEAQEWTGVGGTVAISSDGRTALADASGAGFLGAVVVFQWNGVFWTEQQVLSDKNASFDDSFIGTGLALSSNGNVAFIGGSNYDGTGHGAAFLFTRTGVQWTQQQSLTAAAEIDGESTATALSGDGSIAMAAVSGPEDSYGTVYVFHCSATQCVHQQAIAVKSQPYGYGNGFGGSVSLNSAGTTAVIGTGFSSDPINAAWVFTSG